MTNKTSTEVVDGFTSGSVEAANPTSASGCCGGPAVATTSSKPVASTCCGTDAEARAEGSCCGSAAKEQAVAAGQGCCG